MPSTTFKSHKFSLTFSPIFLRENLLLPEFLSLHWQKYNLRLPMKKSGLFAASVAAASATAISTSGSSSPSFTYNTQQEAELKQNQENHRSSSTEKFAPRFDGLRFIETLITAHR